MTKINCIVGLPGSGKTHLANKMVSEFEKPLIIDDIKDQTQLPENDIYSDIIITDPNFCYALIRDCAEKILNLKYGNINWIFFENNKEKCLINVSHRNDGREVVAFVQHLASIYVIPENYIPLEIWNP